MHDGRSCFREVRFSEDAPIRVAVKLFLWSADKYECGADCACSTVCRVYGEWEDAVGAQMDFREMSEAETMIFKMRTVSDFPSTASLNTDENFGWTLFWMSRPLDRCEGNVAAQRGWWLGHRLVYADGYHMAAVDQGDEGDNPYPQFSGAWEAWADGHNDGSVELFR